MISKLKTFSIKNVLLFAFIFLLAACAVFFLTQQSNAGLSSEIQDLTNGSGIKMKQSSDFRPIFAITFGSTDAGETLQAITVAFIAGSGTPTWNNGAATSSELLDLATTSGGVSLWKESGATPGFHAEEDTQITLASTPQYSGGTFQITPASVPTLAEDDIYYVVLKSDTTGVTDGNSFGVTVPVNGVATNGGPVTLPQVTAGVMIDTVVPVVSTGGPQTGEQSVPVEALVDRSFSEVLDFTTVSTSTVSLKTNEGNTQGGTPTGSNLCGVVFLENGNRIICNHMNDATPLNPSIWYTFTITTDVADNAGNHLAQAFTSSFQTSSFGGGQSFNPPPFIMGTTPPPGGQVPLNGKVAINFNKLMVTSGDGSVVSTSVVQLFLTQNFQETGSNLLNVTTGWNYLSESNQLNIPLPTLTSGSQYRLIVRGDNNTDPGDGSCGGTGEQACAMSTDGMAFPQSKFIVDFTAGASDATGPTVTGSFPDNNIIGVDRAIYDISVSFNEPVAPASVSTTSVKLFADNGDASFDVGTDTLVSTGTVDRDFDGRTVFYSPNALLSASTKYFLVITSGSNGITDLIGNQMSANVVRSFTTGADINGGASDTTNPSVIFANADNYGIAITLSEALKFNTTENQTSGSSSGANDANNANLWTIETSSDGGTTWRAMPLTDPQTGAMQNGKSIRYEARSNTVFIDGLSMPPGDEFRVTASTSIQDLAGNGMESTGRIARGQILSSQDTGGMLGAGGMTGSEPDFFTMGMRPVEAFPKTALAGATTRYRVEFPADTAIPASGKISLLYPSGFSFGASCTTLPTDIFENNDINGPAPGMVTIASVACNSVSRLITVTLGSTATQAGDMIRFEIQGIVNSTVPKDFSTSGYTVDIKTYNASNTLLETMTTMPFFVTTAGSYSASGTVFIDDGAGGGTANNGQMDGTEAGVQSVNVCMGGPFGFQCTNTNSNGVFTFSQLNNGFYNINIPPLSSGNVTGGPFFRDINISNGNAANINFPLQQVSSESILDVYISGGVALANTKLDVFAFSSMSGNLMGGPGQDGPGQGGSGQGGSVLREVTLDDSGIGTVTLPLSQGRWQVGLGPWMPKEPGTIASVPDFTFMPPRPQDVNVDSNGVPDLCTTGAGAANELCFSLAAATQQIKGKVVDGAGNAISNAFVMARPAFFTSDGAGSAGAAQTDSTGNFNLKVLGGTYIVDASMPGMPPSKGFECTVKDNTGASDSNSTADVYCQGVLIVNDITGFSGSAISGTVTDNDLIIKIAKGGTSISGRVLDEGGNAIAFAHVEAMEVNSSGNPMGGWADAPTDNSGNYTLYVSGGSDVALKNWKVRAFAPEFGELPAITVSVVEGTNQTGKNIQATASDFITVQGYVYIDSDTSGSYTSGEGVQGAHVGINGQTGGNGGMTDSDGLYTIKLRSGSGYTIDGFIPGQGPAASLQNQTLTSNVTGKNLVMARPGTVVVYVCTLTDPSAAPSASNSCADRKVSGAFVDARDFYGKGNGTQSNTTAGEYQVVVPAGTYTVRANEPSIGPIGYQDNVTVTGGGTTYVNIAPPALYQVSGTVISTDNACITGATIALSDSSNGRVILAQVQSDGTWSLSNVPNGAYSIMAGKPGCVDSADPGTVVISGANATATARTMTQADSTISGRVWIDADNDFVMDSGENVSFPAMVFATSGTGRRVITEVDTSQTGTNSNYTLSLTAGTWIVKVRSDGSESAEAQVVVAQGDNATQNLKLITIAGYTRKEPKPFSLTPSRGGIVKNSEISDNFELNVPAGAFGTSSNQGSVLTKETTAVTDSANQVVLGGKGIEVTPKDASGQPIKTLSASSGGSATITLSYTDADVATAGGDESKIVIGAWSDEKQQWDPLPTTCDAVNNKCTATVSHFSTFAPVLPTGGGSPSTPSFSGATAVGQTQVNLTWSPISGATGYDIYRAPTLSGPYSRVGSEPTVSSGSTSTYSDTGLSSGTSYSYKISALNDSGESAASTTVSVTTDFASTVGGGGGFAISPTTTQTTDDTGTGTTPTVDTDTTTDTTIEAVTTDTTITTEVTLQPVTIPTLPENPTIVDYQNLLSALLQQLSYLQSQLATAQGSSSSDTVAAISTAAVPQSGSYGAPLYNGLENADVRALQTFLKNQGNDVYPEGLVTGYFGGLTEKAVQRFQEKHGIASSGDQGYGYVGPKTRAAINSLLGL
ncbi:MAG: carboxypeptidase regulatory-like domain-containing protein [bacterium]